MSIFIRTFACMKKNTLHTNLVTTTKALLHVVSLLSAPLLLTAAILMAACSGDDASNTPTPTNDKTEIAFNTATTTWHDATRATTYDNDAALQTEGEAGGFTCTAYTNNSTTVYFGPTEVKWDGTNSKWYFPDGKRYWPAEGSLDFVAYKPNVTSYASVPIYNGTAPSFTATLPMTAAEQDGITELILAFTPNQSKAANAAGVSLNFLHPFTKIIMKLSSTQTNIHIDKIIFKSIKKVGTYTHNSGWALSDDAAVNFEASLDADCVHDQVLGTYLMIPQNWAGAIEIQATWTDWGEPFLHHLYATVPTNWAAGYSYSYTFTITQFDLRVDTERFTEQW